MLLKIFKNSTLAIPYDGKKSMLFLISAVSLFSPEKTRVKQDLINYTVPFPTLLRYDKVKP